MGEIWPPKNTAWSESSIQRYIAMESLRKGLLFHADGNGNFLHGSQASKKKLSGARAGWPDLVYIMPAGRIVWVELKSSIGRVSKEQLELHGKMREFGCEVYVVKAFDGPDGWARIVEILGDR